jgi:pimeloyl-ACP methyl ester carboxylesterase
MRPTLFASTLCTAALLAQGHPAAAAQLTSQPTDIVLENGSAVRIEAGELEVPESRRRPSDRRVTIPYYRLTSESRTPASPIFLLAGGPGSSWLDQFRGEENFREVAFYRTIADVVLFDQRGGGHARPRMTCPKTAQLPDRPFSLAAAGAAMRDLLVACRDHWQRQGVDLAAYNTVENAADVNDLRLALGYDKVTLVGGSYGSHLALQFMRQFPDAVDRVVLYGVEGPDHTWDSPSGMLATLGRIAAHAEQSAALSGRVPAGGLLKALERVVGRLESAPQAVTVGSGPDSRRVVVTADLVRFIARRGAGRRSAANVWPEMILAMDRGDFSIAARAALDVRTLRLPDPVHYSMDCASGISADRLRRHREDPARRLLGDINFEYEALCDLWPAEPLGDGFRTNVVSDIPTMIIHGTWDMSTPIENAREVAASLRRGRLVEVAGGNHGALYNLYERWPGMYPLMRGFLSGKDVDVPETVDDTAAIVYATRTGR